MRKSLWIISAGGAVRITIIALACLFLSATGTRADTFTYTYTGKDFTTASSPYTTSDRITGTLVLSAPLPDNLTSVTDEDGKVLSFTFKDGVQTLTLLNTSALDSTTFFEFGTSSTGAITSWRVQVILASSNAGMGTVNGFLGLSGDQTTTCPCGISQAFNFDDPGTWVGPSSTTVPEPGALSMMLTGLLGLGLLVGVKRYTRNHLATEA